MKKYLSFGLFLVLAVSAVQVSAQTGYGRPKVTPDTTGKKPANQPANQPAGTNPPATQPAATGNAAAPATIRFDTTNTGGFDAKPEISLRNNFAVDRSQVKDRKPLEYEHLRDDDNLWSEFIWREIDAREKQNQSFMYPGKDDNGDQRFFSIMLNAIKNDSVVAFSAENDRFTTPLTMDAVFTQTAGAYDTVDVPDPLTGTVEKIITKKPSSAWILYTLSVSKNR
jgi:hypothetical protein